MKGHSPLLMGKSINRGRARAVQDGKAETVSMLTRERLRLLCRNSSKVLKIALVTDQHDDDVRVCVVAELLQPSGDIDVCSVLCDIVDQ